MTPEQAMVDEFHEAFGLQRPRTFEPLGIDFALRRTLMQEELNEVVEAWAEGDVAEVVDGLCDLLYVTYGTAVSMGLDLAPHFREVHRANMRKLGPDGKPLLRADGKLLKPPGWQAPDHAQLLAAASFYFGRPKGLAVEHREPKTLAEWEVWAESVRNGFEFLERRHATAAADVDRLTTALRATERANEDTRTKNVRLLDENARLTAERDSLLAERASLKAELAYAKAVAGA